MITSAKRAAGLCALLASTCFTSLATAGDLVPPKVYTMTPGGVNVSDGTFVEQSIDFVIGSLKLERFHLSVVHELGSPEGRDASDMFFGQHVSHNYDIFVARSLAPANEYFPRRYKPNVHMGLSNSGLYLQSDAANPSIQNNSDESFRGTLELVGKDYRYIDAIGTVYTFSSLVPVVGGASGSQRVTSIAHPDGRIENLLYTNGRLKLVQDNRGYALVFDYGADGNVSAACGYNLSQVHVTIASTCTGASLKTSYGYADDRLTSVTDASGRTTSYSYTFRQLCITPPGHTGCRTTNIYNANGQVVEQRFADGATWKFSSTPFTRDPEKWADLENNATVTHPDGAISRYVFHRTSPVAAVDQNGRETKYLFDGSSDYEVQSVNHGVPEGATLREVTLPEGNKYDVGRGPYMVTGRETWEAKPGTSETDIVLDRGFGSCALPQTRKNCTKPIWTKDARGYQTGDRTDYTHSPDHGGVLTETGPAVGGIQPQKRYTYAQRSSWLKNASGGYSPAASSIWLLTSMSFCRTSAATGNPAAPCATAGDEVLTSYDYGPDGPGPNNLLLRGTVVTADGQSLRTCQSYDAMGRKVSETGTGANLAACQ